ncbi:hypothetical protein ACIQPT_25555 [Streptomyces sp. NPDC091289]|uniref:hypothetical protein n=1 Tax=Streptomyces sp. NPDC091289 TaxID=3365989 RepID=UPI00381F2821
MYAVMMDELLMAGTSTISISIHEAGKSNSYLFHEEIELIPPTSPSRTARELTLHVQSTLRRGGIGSVSARIKSDGVILDEDGRADEQSLFALGCTAFDEYVSARLMTYSDAWMTYDLKGNPQPKIHATNAPRLTSTLRRLMARFGSEIDPDDSSHFGTPTETGVDNHFEDDGTAFDAWSRFETPSRNAISYETPKFTSSYSRQPVGPVSYFPVRGDQGILGYLWASDDQNSAGFAPREAADLDAYKAGLIWLSRL